MTEWFSRLKRGEGEAARHLWNRYFAKLTELARRELGTAPRQAADEEDVALSVFHSLCRGAARGRFEDVANRDDLWWLLVAITRRKAVDQVRRELRDKRGGGRRQELGPHSDGAAAGGLENFASDEPTPEFVAMLEEERQRLLGLLRDDRLRRVAVWRMEGYTNDEIAGRLGLSTRTVERKLKLIRARWSRELES